MTATYEALAALPAEMAAAVRPSLANATLEGYQRFLEAMFHYTHESGARLRHAAAHAPPELRPFFESMARDEHGHYRLAEADLRAFGRAPGDAVPASVAAFHREFMSTTDPAVWLGALYALESVGSHLQQDAMAGLARLKLTREQVRFVMVHLEADVEHGAQTARHARDAFDAGRGDEVFAAAKRAADFWVALHIGAFA